MIFLYPPVPQPQPEAEPEVEVDGEERRVRAWELERFLDMRFTLAEALAFVNAGADWHVAQRMIDQGCAPSLVMLILL